MARILDITEKNIQHHHPIKRNHGFLATQPVLAGLFILLPGIVRLIKE